MMRLRHGCCTDALNASEVVIPCKASREIFEVLKGIVRFRSVFLECYKRNAALSSVQQRLDSLEGNVAAAQNTVAALRREVGGPSRPGPSAPAPTDHGDLGSEPTTNCLWCGLDGHWVPDCPKKAAGLTPEQAQRQLGTHTLVRKLKEAIAAKKAAKQKRPASGSGRSGGGSSRDGGGSGKRGRPSPGSGPGPGVPPAAFPAIKQPMVTPPPAFLISAMKATVPMATAKVAARWLRKGGRAVVAVISPDGSAMPQPEVTPHGLPDAIKAQLDALLAEYSDVFTPLTGLPPDRPVGHTIPLEPGNRPPATPMYRLSKPEHDELKQQIQDLLAKGMIEPSSSPYAAPVLFVQKKSGELRMCIDYRQLNKITLRDQYPLPRIDDLFDKLSGCKVFSSLDLQAGYHQIRITPEDVPKTAFRTPEGHFQFKVLCFGLTNAPATFQRVMNDAFATVLGKCALVYLDDILVMSRSVQDHLLHLKQVFELLRKNKLYAKLSKCEFMRYTLKFLGHLVTSGGIAVDPDKVSTIANWPITQSLQGLQSFLGAANYVRKFVCNFSNIAAPLTNLCGKGGQSFPWHDWPEVPLTAFNALKAAIAAVPMLRLPDHTKPFQVYCDASLQGLGAVLMQDGYPLAYLSRKLSPAEINYTTGEQEFLSLVTACKEWRCYLEGVPFTLFTDHQPLVALPTQKVLSRRQARWMEFMSRFSYSLVHIAGTVNPADPLSRIVHDSPESVSVCAVTTRRQAKLSLEGGGAREAGLRAAAPAAISAKSPLALSQFEKDTTCVEAMLDPIGSETPVTQDETAQYPAAPAAPMGLSDQLTLGYQQDPAFTAGADHSGMYQDTDGLWRISGKDLVVVPNVPELREHILHEMHDAAYAGHVGMTKTLERVTRVFWWNTVRADVRDYVGTCDACQRDKSSNSKPGGLLRPLTIPGYRWEHVSMDLVTKLPTGTHGYDAICVIVDRLSKMVHFVPCKESMNAMAFTRLFINNVFRLHGLPAEVLTDRGAHFNNKFWHAVKKLLGMKTNMSTAYRPQSDGQTERYNRVLEEMLRHYISPTQADWPDHLALAEFAVNNSWQESIHSTPFFLNTGQSPVTPGLRDLPDGGRCPSAHAFATWWKEGVAHARRHMADAQARYKRHADTGLKDVEFEVGAQVLLSTRNLRIKTGKVRKFVPRYVGPFVVEAKINANAYKLTLPANMSRLHPVFHVSLLKKYSGSDVGIMPPPVEWMDETPVYYVERLLDHRYVRAGKAGEFLVQWEGYDASFNTWEPRANLTGCDKLLAEYNAIHCLNKCRARHIFIDTRGLYGLMHDAGMLKVLTEAGVTSLDKFRNGALPDPARPGHYIEGPENSKREKQTRRKRIGQLAPVRRALNNGSNDSADDTCGYEFEPAPQPASSCPSWKHRQETAAKAWIARALHDKQAIIDNAPAAAAAAAEECELLRQLMQARLDAAILSCCSGAQLEELPATVVERVGMAHRFQLTVQFLEILNVSHHPFQLYPERRPIRPDIFSSAYFSYLAVTHRATTLEGLGCEGVPGGPLADCPICVATPGVVDNYPVAICTDAMTKLNHHAGCGKASRDIPPRLNSHIDARQQEEGFDWEVERRFKEEQLNLQYSMAGAGADDVHTCASSLSCSRPTASCAKRSCDITGLCGFVCCHGVPALGLFCNMRTPEQFTYYLLGLERLLLRAHNVVHIYVDIACRLKITWDRYVCVHGLDPSWSSVKMMVPMMHAASHDTACQLANNARFLKGTAFRVGEQTEQAWSRLKPLGKTTRYMTLGHRSDVIQSALSAIALEKQSKMVELLDGCHTNMVTKQEEVAKKLSKLREQALAEGVTSGEEASIKYQSQHLLVGAKASRVPHAWPAEYVELKLVASAIRSETGVTSLDLCHDRLPPLLPDMAKLLTRGRTLPQLTGIETKLLDLELEHGVHNTTGSWLCPSLPGVSVHAHGLQSLKTAKISGLRDQVWHLAMIVAQLETKKDNWGIADKDTRALAKQAKAKMRLARQALDDLALWEVLGTNQVLDQVQVSHSQLRDMVQGGPAPWEEECQSTPLGKELFFGRQFLHLLSDSERCLEQLAVLHLERARLHAWLEHMCGVCQAACTKLEVQPSIAMAGKLFYLQQHLAHFKAQILQLHGLLW
ncbi:hypothetical protein QJQ45_003135 [Haematococcus lacustris]|nr:hypothetical protein QJQ45_003135 [Haematococcus lacustris]